MEIAEVGMIGYGRQWIDEADEHAVLRALRSDFLTTGPMVQAFEAAFAEHVGCKYAVAVSSGTAALHLAVLAAGIEPGSRVVTSANTWVASANCAAHAGCVPDFCDIDPLTYNLCPDALRDGWRADTRAVIAVDYAGQACDMPSIAEVARARNAIVVEDAAHAVGGGFAHGGDIWKIGAHPWADITTFSFHPVKTMTTGEGGMLATDRADWADRARALRNHGLVKDPDRFEGQDDSAAELLAERGPWYHEMQSLGFNYRLTDVQCALGLSQLRRLDAFQSRRREIVSRYDEAFAAIDGLGTPTVVNEADRSHISWHLYTVQIDFDRLGKSRTRVMRELEARGVGSQVLYIPVYLQPWYRRTYGYRAGKCPNAERYYEKALSLPLYPAMSEEDVATVISAVKTVLSA